MTNIKQQKYQQQQQQQQQQQIYYRPQKYKMVVYKEETDSEIEQDLQETPCFEEIEEGSNFEQQKQQQQQQQQQQRSTRTRKIEIFDYLNGKDAKKNRN